MIIQNVRVDWLFVWETGNKGKYGACIMLPKGSPQEKQAKDAVAKEITKGVAAGKFTEAQARSKNFKGCIRDGDQEIIDEDRPAHYAGHSFFNASNASQPGIVGPDTAPLMDQNLLYSGCFCNVDINFAPFNVESKGVGAYLQHIMLVKEGERLDGRQSAEAAFAGLAPEGDLQ